MLQKLLAVISAFAITFTPLTVDAKLMVIHVNRPPNIHTYKVEIVNGQAIGEIDLQGKIDDDAANAIDAAFLEFKDKDITNVDIHLNSPGGLLTAGSRIALDIVTAEEAGVLVSAHVDHQELCASMCTGIFAVAQVRETAPDTIWVFHSPYVQLTDAQKKDPTIVEGVKADQEEAREALFEMYKMADPIWAEKELRQYVWNDSEKELMLAGVQLPLHSSSYINVPIELLE